VGAIPGIHAFPSQGNSVLLDCEGSGKTVEAFKQELLSKGYLSRNLSGGRDVRGENFLRIRIGQAYVYEVRTVEKYIRPGNNSSVFKHEDYPWLTLITCRGYDEDSDYYLWRVAVRAIQTRID